MPLYEYRCEACGHRFELWQRMGADKEGVSCPSCGSREVARLWSTFASSSSASSGSPSTAGCASGFS